jgi:hypothetical protein
MSAFDPQSIFQDSYFKKSI